MRPAKSHQSPDTATSFEIELGGVLPWGIKNRGKEMRSLLMITVLLLGGMPASVVAQDTGDQLCAQAKAQGGSCVVLRVNDVAVGTAVNAAEVCMTKDAFNNTVFGVKGPDGSILVSTYAPTGTEVSTTFAETMPC